MTRFQQFREWLAIRIAGTDLWHDGYQCGLKSHEYNTLAGQRPVFTDDLHPKRHRVFLYPSMVDFDQDVSREVKKLARRDARGGTE